MNSNSQPNLSRTEAETFRSRYIDACHAVDREPIIFAILSSGTKIAEKDRIRVHGHTSLFCTPSLHILVSTIKEAMRCDPKVRQLLEDAVMQLNTEE